MQTGGATFLLKLTFKEPTDVVANALKFVITDSHLSREKLENPYVYQ